MLFNQNNPTPINYLQNLPAIILDTETTGLINARIIEAAWLEVNITNGVLGYGCQFTQRYNPSMPIDLGALKTHHILDSELVGMPCYTTFSLLPHVEYVICQNSAFDMRFVPNAEKYKAICTVGMSRKLWAEADSHSLGAMMYHIFGRTPEIRDMQRSAHSALPDVYMTYMLLEKIIEKAQIQSLDELFKFSEMAKITTAKMPFGKYKGVYLVDIKDKSYLQWLTQQPDMDVELKRIAAKLL